MGRWRGKEGGEKERGKGIRKRQQDGETSSKTLPYPPDYSLTHFPVPVSSPLLRTACLCHPEINVTVLTPTRLVLGGGAFGK